MSSTDILVFIICLGFIASLIIQIIKIEPLISDIKNIRTRLDAIDAKINMNKDHTDLRISRISRLVDYVNKIVNKIIE